MTQNGGDRGGLADGAVGHQREEDDAHRLLRVVGAVRQRDQRRRTDLAAAEAGLGARLVHTAGDPVDQPGGDGPDQDGQERGHDGRDDRLGRDALPDHPVRADGGDGGADDAADQRVRGTRGDTEEPGEQVPDDAADQAGEHQFQRHDVPVDEALGDRGRHGGGKERSHQVEDRRQCDRCLGLERATGDGGCHRVGGVVEAVSEVECECRNNDNDQEEQVDVHRP